jgi:hypothetical protein
MTTLSPSPDGVATPTHLAQARLEARIIRKEATMKQSIFNRYRPAWVALVVILVLAVSLCFPQVRAIANSFLGLFRVERIEAIEVGISLEDLPSEMETHFIALDNLLSDQVVVDQAEEPVVVESVAEAEAVVSFDVRLPSRLADTDQYIVAQNAASIGFTLDRERWLALLESMGYEDFEIPKSADGAEVKVNVPNAVVIGFGDCDINQAREVVAEGLGDCMILMQSETPTIEATPGLDINAAGQLMLQVLGMSAEEATAFTNRVDWATTLVVPVPQGAEYRNVKVDGADGVLLEDTYADGKARYTLLWVKEGMFYALTGDGLYGEVLDIANSMK